VPLEADPLASFCVPSSMPCRFSAHSLHHEPTAPIQFKQVCAVIFWVTHMVWCHSNCLYLMWCRCRLHSPFIILDGWCVFVTFLINQPYHMPSCRYCCHQRCMTQPHKAQEGVRQWCLKRCLQVKLGSALSPSFSLLMCCNDWAVCSWDLGTRRCPSMKLARGSTQPALGLWFAGATTWGWNQGWGRGVSIDHVGAA